jgi:hypothetical protein
MLTAIICGALGLAAGILLSAAGPGWEHGAASVLWWSGAAFWATVILVSFASPSRRLGCTSEMTAAGDRPSPSRQPSRWGARMRNQSTCRGKSPAPYVMRRATFYDTLRMVSWKARLRREPIRRGCAHAARQARRLDDVVSATLPDLDLI